MLRRVELAWPVEDAALRQRIIDECLVAYLQDDLDAWVMDANGHYTRVPPKRSKRQTTTQAHGAQAALMGLYAAKL
jgi:polyphosphate kinase